MKQLFALLLSVSVMPLWAQVARSGQPSAQVQVQDDAQRRAELRRVLQQKQTAETSQRQLSAQQRAELRDALRQQRAGQTAAAAAAQPTGSSRP